MYISFVFSSYVLLCLSSLVKSWHATNKRPQGEFKPFNVPASGVFHVGQLPHQGRGRVHVFTNPPTFPTTTPRPPPTTTRKPTPRPTTPPLINKPKIPETTEPFNWNSYFATTYPSTKKGQCPDFDTVHASCYGRCHSDDDCFYERKCCRDGYGFGCCTDPFQPGIFDNFFNFGPTTVSFFFKKKK